MRRTHSLRSAGEHHPQGNRMRAATIARGARYERLANMALISRRSDDVSAQLLIGRWRIGPSLPLRPAALINARVYQAHAPIFRRDFALRFLQFKPLLLSARANAITANVENAGNYDPRKRPFSHGRRNVGARTWANTVGRSSNSIVRLDPLLRARASRNYDNAARGNVRLRGKRAYDAIVATA